MDAVARGVAADDGVIRPTRDLEDARSVQVGDVHDQIQSLALFDHRSAVVRQRRVGVPAPTDHRASRGVGAEVHQTHVAEAALAQLAGSLEGTLQFADHLDKVLTDRADMFLKMRDGLRVLKEKARAAAYPKPNGGTAPAALD